MLKPDSAHYYVSAEVETLRPLLLYAPLRKEKEVSRCKAFLIINFSSVYIKEN